MERNMAKRTAAGTLALAVCLGGGIFALRGALTAEAPPPPWFHQTADAEAQP